jgi:hypothetical protein
MSKSFQNDEEIVDLDPCEGQLLIEDHIQSTFEKDGSDHDHLAILNSLKEIFIQEPYQSSNALVALKYNELHIIQKSFQEDLQDDCDTDDGNIVDAFETISDVIVSYEDQPVNIQSLLPEHHEMEISERQDSIFFYDQTIYDEYPEDVAQISFSASIQTYSGPPLFYEDKGSDIEMQKEQSSISAPMRLYSSDPIYDDYQADSWTDSEGDKEQLQGQVIMSSSSPTVELEIQKISELTSTILESESARRIQQKVVSNVNHEAKSIQKYLIQFGQQ